MKCNRFSLILMVLLLLSGCYSPPEPTEAVTVPPVTQTTCSDQDLPDYTAEEIYSYFEEVVLDVEYSDGDGDITLVQKWTAPIAYRVYGSPTEEDLAVLNGLVRQLNQIPGFPGLYTAEAEGDEALRISFLDPEAFRDSFFAVVNGEDAYGATQFWYYIATNEIHSARIGCRTDISQQERNSVLAEEIVNTLGISDTLLRKDSITYQHSNENTVLSDVDWLLLKLLYHPQMQCGMDAEQCRTVIDGLYREICATE